MAAREGGFFLDASLSSRIAGNHLCGLAAIHMAQQTVHFRIEGRVQGVGFRDSLCDVARRFRVDGWVRNRSDGSIEAVARGTPAACESLLAWARRGPPAARVDRIDTRPATHEEEALVAPGFRRLPTL
jgi:acylphosphatase